MKAAREHIENALREIATLFMAFAPVDSALSGGHNWLMAVGFVIAAVALFAFALRLEGKRNVRDSD